MIYFLMLIKDNNNTLKLPSKKCKNLQLYIDQSKISKWHIIKFRCLYRIKKIDRNIQMNLF